MCALSANASFFDDRFCPVQLVLSCLTTAVVVFFLSGSDSSIKISIFKNSDFILAIPRLYLTILIRKINSSFSLLSYIQPIWLFFFLRMDKLAMVELNRVVKSEIQNIKLHLREKKSQKIIVRK